MRRGASLGQVPVFVLRDVSRTILIAIARYAYNVPDGSSFVSGRPRGTLTSDFAWRFG
jgi:hypothetical protein